MSVEITVNGETVTVVRPDSSLLDVLREQLRLVSVKDGCSPQGQCGCCTVLVDGAPRVACVTPARRVRGRAITTVEGLDASTRDRWSSCFLDAGASQCGFCTPGIVLRLEALRAKDERVDEAAVEQGLLAHLCRCTGWRTIVDACDGYGDEPRTRDLDLASQRAAIEGRSHQRVDAAVPLGAGGFADDTAPAGCLVAVSDGRGGWVVGETLDEARSNAGRVQGRRTTVEPSHPLEPPHGEWDVSLRTTWVEPGYLETDASWCEPGGEPASPLANGGAFGGKVSSPVGRAARELADQHGRPVRVLLSREDSVRLGPKRPPIAAGVRFDGRGVIRVVRTDGIASAIHTVAPDFEVYEVDVPGPPTSVALRGAGWVEAAVLLAGAVGEPGRVTAPDGGSATAEIVDGRLRVRVRCGDPLDEVVLRSYCVGAAHMGLSWVTSEALTVDEAGEALDLTIRSFGILRARDMPPVDIEIEGDGPPVNGSDAVFAAVASAVWEHQGRPVEWPTGRMLRT
jgi:aerobic-type carbon monoxide dehydrogenase small subunit (CoxS/CutS family)